MLRQRPSTSLTWKVEPGEPATATEAAEVADATAEGVKVQAEVAVEEGPALLQLLADPAVGGTLAWWWRCIAGGQCVICEA